MGIDIHFHDSYVTFSAWQAASFVAAVLFVGATLWACEAHYRHLTRDRRSN